MLKDKNIVVTGGLGFIGSHLVERLSKDNEVTVIDDGSSGTLNNIRHLSRDHIVVINGSVAELNLKKIFRGMDYVFHEAAVTRGVLDPVGCSRANVDGTLNVLDASRDAGVKKVIFASSSSVYGDADVRPLAEGVPVRPSSLYAVTKAVGEMYCGVFRETYGLPTIALRYFDVFGPRQDPRSPYAAFIPEYTRAMLRRERPVIHGDGEQSRDFIFVRHVVDANVLACEHGLSGVYNVACGRRVTLNRLVDVINRVMGTDIKPVYVDARPGDIRHSVADVYRAKMFHFEPKGDFREELRETIGWFKESMDRERLSWKSSSSVIQSLAK
jgi:UDP-glucose 4-epimerase